MQDYNRRKQYTKPNSDFLCVIFRKTWHFMVHVQYFQMLTIFHFIHNFSAVVSLQFNKTALLFIEKLRKCHFCATLQKNWNEYWSWVFLCNTDRNQTEYLKVKLSLHMLHLWSAFITAASYVSTQRSLNVAEVPQTEEWTQGLDAAGVAQHVHRWVQGGRTARETRDRVQSALVRAQTRQSDGAARCHQAAAAAAEDSHWLHVPLRRHPLHQPSLYTDIITWWSPNWSTFIIELGSYEVSVAICVK